MPCLQGFFPLIEQTCSVSACCMDQRNCWVAAKNTMKTVGMTLLQWDELQIQTYAFMMMIHSANDNFSKFNSLNSPTKYCQARHSPSDTTSTRSPKVSLVHPVLLSTSLNYS
mmetsp:Transcript_5939/g.11281  ORF Transcript_5939/g.11281 Transcript_5939/m.11281 type:complete len:112 (+) Transcript_5939:2192-2527(+)